MRAAERLSAEGVDLAVVNARWVKPLDRELIASTVRPGSLLVTVEDHNVMGGFGSAVLEAISDLAIPDVATLRLGVPDRFIAHATQTEQWREVGLDEEGIYEQAWDFHLRRERPPLVVVKGA